MSTDSFPLPRGRRSLWRGLQPAAGVPLWSQLNKEQICIRRHAKSYLLSDRIWGFWFPALLLKPSATKGGITGEAIFATKEA